VSEMINPDVTVERLIIEIFIAAEDKW
jgi:hypothetical protein